MWPPLSRWAYSRRRSSAKPPPGSNLGYRRVKSSCASLNRDGSYASDSLDVVSVVTTFPPIPDGPCSAPVRLGRRPTQASSRLEADRRTSRPRLCVPTELLGVGGQVTVCRAVRHGQYGAAPPPVQSGRKSVLA